MLINLSVRMLVSDMLYYKSMHSKDNSRFLFHEESKYSYKKNCRSFHATKYNHKM